MYNGTKSREFLFNGGTERKNADGALLCVVTQRPRLMEALPYSTHGF